MSLKISVAHDYTCPWCWIGFFQAKRLERDFGAEIEWLSYDLWPEELAWPEPAPRPPEVGNRPKTATRLELAYAAENMDPPTAERPRRMRIHNALEATEFAKDQGNGDAFVEALYRAYWERGEEIGNPAVLARLAAGIVEDVPDMLKAIEEGRFKSRIIGFDAPAYASGVYNVPTFFIDGERLAEQPYTVIRKYAEAARKLAAS